MRDFPNTEALPPLVRHLEVFKTKPQQTNPKTSLEVKCIWSKQRGTEGKQADFGYGVAGGCGSILSCKVQCIYNYRKLGSFLECWHARTESSAALFILEHCRTGSRVVWKQAVLELKMKDLRLVQNPGQFLVGEQKLSWRGICVKWSWHENQRVSGCTPAATCGPWTNKNFYTCQWKYGLPTEHIQGKH